MELNKLDDFCVKHGCTREELLKIVDEVVSDINHLNLHEIKHELATMMAEDYVKEYQTEHLK